MSARILIVSNNCLAKQNSNGRTLLNLLGGFEGRELYQFYVANEVPREATCAKFLRITDRDVIRSYTSFKGRRSLWEGDLPEEDMPISAAGAGYGRKTALKSFVRDILWNASAWVKRALLRFVRDNEIDLVLLQAGDNVFLHRLARRVAKACRIPLLIYNTEDYYFKDYDYMKKTMGAGFAYRLYHRFFCREFKRLIGASSREVYNCRGLEELYNTTFGRAGATVYSSTDFTPVEHIREDGLVSYAGNLGCGRHRVLMRIGELLQALSPDLYLDVYGPAGEQVIEDFKKCEGIRYHGFVSYSEVCRVIEGSRLLVHVESFDEYYRRDTRFAFSTKLADYGASNIPVLLCAPASCEAYSYIARNETAFVAADEAEMANALLRALYDGEERERVRGRALALSQENNDYKKNGKRFKEIIEEVLHDRDKTRKGE